MFSILAWNIQQGGGSRINAIIHAIAEKKPSVCVFSEFHNNESGTALRYALLRLGYRFQFVSHALKEDNSVCICSTLPCDSRLYMDADETYANNILCIHFSAFSILGVYLPHKKKHRLFEYIQQHILHDNIPYIVTGDMNSGINGIDQEGDSFWYENDMKAFEKIHYYDGFRHIHGHVKEYSWVSHQGNGYRYDHTYVHQSLLPVLKSCHYIHEWREQKLSDHSPMWISLG